MTEYILKEFAKRAKKEKTTLGGAVWSYEKEIIGNSDSEITNRLKSSFNVFEKAVKKGMESEYEFKNLMFSDDSKKLSKSKTKILGSTLHKACVYALAITENNLNMGKVVACPTAGASGIVPACILAVSEEYFLPEKAKHHALLAASAVELSLIKNASISGAAHGCQAECGSAAAMAAAAIVELLNHDSRTNPEMCEAAAAMALKNMLGLVCDPVAGIVSVPCRKRNAVAVGIAFVAAQMALAKIESYIPFDEVADAMEKVGAGMDDRLKETARGGLARTKTGMLWEKKKDNIVKKAKEKGLSFSEMMYKEN